MGEAGGEPADVRQAIVHREVLVAEFLEPIGGTQAGGTGANDEDLLFHSLHFLRFFSLTTRRISPQRQEHWAMTSVHTLTSPEGRRIPACERRSLFLPFRACPSAPLHFP